MSPADPLVPAASESLPHAAEDADVLALTAPTPGVALWLCHLDRVSADVTALSASLSAQQRAGDALGFDPSAVRLRRGVRGRPELDGDYAVDFNVSHTGDTALIAIATGIQD